MKQNADEELYAHHQRRTERYMKIVVVFLAVVFVATLYVFIYGEG